MAVRPAQRRRATPAGTDGDLHAPDGRRRADARAGQLPVLPVTEDRDGGQAGGRVLVLAL